MDVRNKIEELAAPFIESIGAFIVDIQSKTDHQRTTIEVFVDTDSGITIAQCSEISRQLSAALELQNSIQGSYILEVSSPGLNKPLKLLRQYHKNIGRTFRVRFHGENGIQELHAALLAVTENLLTFDSSSDGQRVIPFNMIIESIEELPW